MAMPRKKSATRAVQDQVADAFLAVDRDHQHVVVEDAFLATSYCSLTSISSASAALIDRGARSERSRFAEQLARWRSRSCCLPDRVEEEYDVGDAAQQLPACRR